MTRAYYNEFEPYAAEWLRNLIAAGLIADGDVDERSILEVAPSDLKGYTQCHFFAGIGVWSHALRGAGWPDDREVWTGSCPCQPFSAAGKRKGTADDRHLWPEFFRLIQAVRPRTVFGEQVASKDGLAWLDIVSADLEGADYTFGAVDTCAAGFGAPHIRQRLYWVADADSQRFSRRSERRNDANKWGLGSGCVGGERLADTPSDGCEQQRQTENASVQGDESERGGEHAGEEYDGELSGRPQGLRCSGFHGAVRGYWDSADWLFCRDQYWRAVESDTFPLADGDSSFVGRIRAYGNSIVAPQAEAVVTAFLEVERGLV